mgnify:CR=1 FL=1
MKFTRPTIAQLFAMAALATSGAAFASGSHAGGHGHDEGGETAIGKPGVAAKASRTITIEMSDNMRYTPSNIQVKQGETVRFIVKNDLPASERSQALLAVAISAVVTTAGYLLLDRTGRRAVTA